MNEVKMLNIGGSDQNIKDQYARNIIAPSENNLTAQDQPYASRDYDEGDYLIGQDRNLYKALTDIHTGDILAVNVNVKATTISDELVALENSSVEEALEIIAYTENSSLSTREYAIGDNLYWNYGSSQGLYKATAVIAIGDAFAVGSNIEAAEPIAKQLEIVEDEVDAIVNDLGAKNFLPNTATSQTISGVTFSVYRNGTINVVGSASENVSFIICWCPSLNAGRYIINGCPSGGSDETYYLHYSNAVDETFTDYGDGSPVFAPFDYTQYTSSHVKIVVKPAAGSVNLRFKPMIRLASIKDDTYVPYSRTNRELTGEVESMLNALGAKNLLRITSTSTVVQNITFTINSNGTVIANGTCNSSNDAYFVISSQDYPKGKYRKTGCPRGGSLNTYFVGGGTGNDIGDGTFFESDESTSYSTIIVIRKGITVSNLVFRPMVCPATIVDDTYAPYTMTNRELTKQLTDNTLTSVSSSYGTVEGGYKQIGNIVILNVRLTLTTALGSGAAYILTGLPLAVGSSNKVAVAVNLPGATALLNGATVQLHNRDAGTLAVGTVIILSTTYVCK